MRDPLADALLRIRALEEQPLVVAHARPVIPPLRGVVLDAHGLARAVRVPMLDGDKVRVVIDGFRGRESQRARLHDAVDGPPDVDDAIPPLQELLGLRWVRDVQAHARLRRLGGLVDVRAVDGLAVRSGVLAADGVVEDDDAVGARDGVEQELLHLRVVDALDVVVRVEGLVGGRGGDVAEDLEGVAVEGVLVLAAADVGQLDLVQGLAEVALRLTLGRLLDVVEGRGAVGGRHVEGQFGLDGAAGDVAGVVILRGA